MKNRWLLNLALGAMIAVLILIAASRPGIEPEPVEPALTALKADEIRSLRLLRPGGKEILMKKAGKDWRMTAPMAARANRFRVEGLLGLAGAASKGRFPADEGKLGEYGLDSPKVTVWLDGEEIRLGGTHPINRQRYALYKGQVHLIPDTHLRYATGGLNEFFSSKLFVLDRPLSALVFPDFSLILVEGSWRLKPENPQVSADDIGRFVDEWRYARALTVAPYSGKPVREHLRFTFTNGAGQEDPTRDLLEVGVLARSPELILYRKDEGLEYGFPEETGKRLLRIGRESGAGEGE